HDVLSGPEALRTAAILQSAQGARTRTCSSVNQAQPKSTPTRRSAAPSRGVASYARAQTRMEPLWSPVVATGGNRCQIDCRSKLQKHAKSVTTGCHRLPETFHGKEERCAR